MLLEHTTRLASSLLLFNEGIRMLASSEMMAITTSSSIRVKPRRGLRKRLRLAAGSGQGRISERRQVMINTLSRRALLSETFCYPGACGLPPMQGNFASHHLLCDPINRLLLYACRRLRRISIPTPPRPNNTIVAGSGVNVTWSIAPLK